MKLFVSFKGKRFPVDVCKAGFFRKGLGLIFRTRDTENLLFDFYKDVTWQGNLTSWFVFFPFLTLWLDDNNKIIDFKVVRPFIFSISQKKKFRRIVEIPFNDKNRDLIVRFIGEKNYFEYCRW